MSSRRGRPFRLIEKGNEVRAEELWRSDFRCHGVTSLIGASEFCDRNSGVHLIDDVGDRSRSLDVGTTSVPSRSKSSNVVRRSTGRRLPMVPASPITTVIRHASARPNHASHIGVNPRPAIHQVAHHQLSRAAEHCAELSDAGIFAR